jgi:hypothetical protein
MQVHVGEEAAHGDDPFRAELLGGQENGRMDLSADNALGRAVHASLYESDPPRSHGPAELRPLHLPQQRVPATSRGKRAEPTTSRGRHGSRDNLA